jgi:hypothetical protein
MDGITVAEFGPALQTSYISTIAGFLNVPTKRVLITSITAKARRSGGVDIETGTTVNEADSFVVIATMSNTTNLDELDDDIAETVQVLP